MRLSRPRLLLRAALLLLVAGFMAWRGFDTRATAALPGLDPESAASLGRVALVEWLLAGLAVLTAGAAVFPLLRPERPAPRRRSLDLGGEPPAEGTSDPAAGPEPRG